MSKTTTVEDLHIMIGQLDPSLDSTGDAYRCALILLASAIVGPNPERVAGFTALPRAFVGEVTDRLRRNGVWTEEHVVADWVDPEDGGISFWIDVNVGLGLMERRDP